MYKFSIYRPHYIANLKLALPVILSQVGQIVVQMVDNAMVGSLGATELAAASFAGSVIFAPFVMLMGITMGLTPLVGESYARGNNKKSAHYLQNSLVSFTLIVAAIFTLLYATSPLIYKMGQPKEVVDMAEPYYKLLVWSTLPFVIFSIFKQFLEGIGNTKVTMFVVISTNALNILGNYLLIYGNFGFPELGVLGAGVSTLMARICMPIFIVSYFVLRKKYRWYISQFAIKEFSLYKIKKLLKVGAPISTQMFLEVSAFALTAIMVGWIGTEQIAANQIAFTISSFAFMAVVGVSAATTIRVSHEYGRGNYTAMNRAAVASFHIGLLWNCITATTFILLRSLIPQIFTTDAKVIEIASILLIYVSLFQFSDGLQCIAIGVLRGIKDVKAIMLIAFVSYIMVNLPVGYICAFKLGLNEQGLWVGFIVGISLASILLIARYRKSFNRIRGVK